MTETGNQQTEHLQVVSEPVHLAGLQHREHRLADIESVPPVVIFHWTIVLLDTESPAANNLAGRGYRRYTSSWGGTYFVRNMEFIDQVEVEEHSQDNLESLAVMVLGVIEFITKLGNILHQKNVLILRETCKD